MGRPPVRWKWRWSTVCPAGRPTVGHDAEPSRRRRCPARGRAGRRPEGRPTMEASGIRERRGRDHCSPRHEQSTSVGARGAISANATIGLILEQQLGGRTARPRCDRRGRRGRTRRARVWGRTRLMRRDAPRRAPPSPLALAPMMRRPAASNAATTSGSRSMKMPDASIRPPGRSGRGELGREGHQQRRDEVGEHQVPGAAPVGREATPSAGMRRARPLRRALATVASTAIGSVSTPSTDAAPELGRRDGQDARAAAHVDRAPAPSMMPSSDQRSMPARHSRVVGWSPVPKAMPGSSARTTSPGCAR